VPHVDHQVDRHGHPRWWYRRRGEKRQGPLPMPGTPDFLSVWKALDDAARGAAMPALGSSRTRPGSLSEALVAYYTSPAWTVEFAESSRNMRRPILEKLREKFGDARLSDLRREHVQALLDKLKPNAQKNWSKALTGLIKFALRAGLIKTSPMVGVVKDKAPKTGGLPAWTEDHWSRRARTIRSARGSGSPSRSWSTPVCAVPTPTASGPVTSKAAGCAISRPRKPRAPLAC
jgi:hypothetical protein